MEGTAGAEDCAARVLPRWVFPLALGTVMAGALLLRVWGLRMRDLAPLAFWRTPGPVAPVVSGTEINRT
ncbi:MAG: hypothetical protein AB7Y46_01460 [Armatimonadota bacterium]